MDKNNDKIRIPNETYCPNKKINFNNFVNNTPKNISSSNNNTNNIETIKVNINKNNNNINLNTSNQNNSPQITSKANPSINPNQNISQNFLTPQDNSSEEGVTISPIKSIVTSALSKASTISEPRCKLQKFLPPKTSKFHKTLVLDLDETLIHSYFDCSPPRAPDLSFDIVIEKKKIHVNSIVRPGAREFLESVSAIFEVVIFTASLSEYANPLLDFIDKNKKCKFRLYREHCCSFTNGFTNSFTKDLKKLDRDMKNLIIIDNNPKSYMLNKENGIPIKTWVEDINDRELIKLIPYLTFLGNENIEDVRPFLKQVNSGNILNYEQFDKIISNYNTDKEKSKEGRPSNSVKDTSNTISNVSFSEATKKSNGIITNTPEVHKEIKKANGNNKYKNIVIKEINKSNDYMLKNAENKNKKESNNIETNGNVKENKIKINKNRNNSNNNINENHNKLNKNNTKFNNSDNQNIRKLKNNKDNSKNKSSNNISFKINIGNKNYSPNKESIKMNRSSDKINKKNDDNLKMNNNIKKINISNNNISKKSKSNNNKKIDKNIVSRNDNNNKEIQNLSLGNNCNKKNNKCDNQQKYNFDISKSKNYNRVYDRNTLKENIHINKRYDILEIEKEYLPNKSSDINDITKLQKEIKNIDIKNNFANNSIQGIALTAKNNNKISNLNMNIHAAKSTNNINKFKINFSYSNDGKLIQNYDKDIINNVKKDIRIDNDKYRPTDELLNECIIKLNNAHILKNSSTSITKNLQNLDDIQEKTIINDDMDDEEKTENKDKEILEELFDIDIEKDDFDDSHLYKNKQNNEDKNMKKEIEKEKKKEKDIEIKENINQKKCYEVDDAKEYNKNIEKEKEKINNDKSEGNTINTKDSIKYKRKINKNLFNKSRPFPVHNKKDFTTDGLFINQYQSGLKMSSNHNNFLQSKKIFPKELFYYSTRKSKDYNNNMSSSNQKIFKEKNKSNLYLKNSNNNENNELQAAKGKPAIKNNLNAFNLFPKTNKNSHHKNQKILLGNSNNLYLLHNNNGKNGGETSLEKKISFTNQENIFNISGNKVKRPTSCVNKKSEKIMYNNDKSKKIIKLDNKGKKIFLRTNNKTDKSNIYLDINNINIHQNDNSRKSKNDSNIGIEYEDNKSNRKSKTSKNNPNVYVCSILSHSGGDANDIFYSKNSEGQKVKLSKGTNAKNYYLNIDKEVKQKRCPSAMNNKYIKHNNKNILL